METITSAWYWRSRQSRTGCIRSHWTSCTYAWIKRSILMSSSKPKCQFSPWICVPFCASSKMSVDPCCVARITWAQIPVSPYIEAYHLHLLTNSVSLFPAVKGNQTKRESLLRCENPNTTYCGTADGKSISERYSVLVPLNMSRPSQHSGGFVRQTLVFSFSCQNSCFGRKETCLVFCLENSK